MEAFEGGPDMKRVLFTMLAVFALVLAMPAVAQEELDDSRTNPDARSIAPGSGLTITGTVVEWDEKQLVIQTTTGTQHIQLTPNTEKPVELDAGESVSVDYTRTSQGIMIAQKIRPEGAVTGEATTTATTDLTADTDADLDANASLQADVDTYEDTETDVTTDLDTDVEATTADTGYDDDLGADTYEQDSDLPATGSELPLLALLGLLSVAAAFGVRSFVR
jgi:hypothetical protein